MTERDTKIAIAAAALFDVLSETSDRSIEHALDSILHELWRLDENEKIGSRIEIIDLASDLVDEGDRI